MPNTDDNRYDYLNRQRPLWILEDQVSSMERDISQITFTTTAKPQNPMYFLKYRRERTTDSPAHPSLPTHYVQPNRRNYSQISYRIKPKINMPWRREQPSAIPLDAPSMPTFDSVPNDIDASDEMPPPVFIYNGPKGQLIMNTMLSAHKYPMQEPVPGQVLYPPTVPIFRPKPIVQQFRVPGNHETMNLTLIPFYAHEAIAMPQFYYDFSRNGIAYTNSAETSSLQSSAVIYEASSPSKSPTSTAKPATNSAATKRPKLKKKRRHKKPKHYTVYRSPDEVHWRPTEPTLERFSEATTSYPMVLANPLQNHRYYEGVDDYPTTMKPINNNDEESNFRIVYVDESLEKPFSREVMPTKSSARSPLLSSHYRTEKEYYAFPVYTLGKLLRPETSAKPKLSYSSYIHPDYEKQKSASEQSVDTWFIMNSRYKGRRLKDGTKLLSSKYVEVSPSNTNENPEKGPTLETSDLQN